MTVSKVGLRDVGVSLGRLFAEIPRAFGRHLSEVDRTRYCKCCGGPATLYVTTVLKKGAPSSYGVSASELAQIARGSMVKESESLVLAPAPNFFFCGDHHPLAGEKSAESLETLAQVDKRLTFYLITPNPYK